MDLSPRHLEPKLYIPVAIKLSKLNPQPAKSVIGSRKETFNSLKVKDIDNAQTKARHVIMQSRLEACGIPRSRCCQQSFCTCRIIGENTKLLLDKSVTAKKSVKDSIPKSRLSFNVTTGKGESNMRIRQVTRLTNQICECIKEIEDTTSSTKTITKVFITLYELQLKKKRLDDYLNYGTKTLFTLKRELNHLEAHVAHKKKDCKWLRILSTVSRTLLQLLLGIKNLSDSIIRDSVGLIFYKELLRTSWRLFSVAQSIGIKFTKQDILRQLDSQFSKIENTDMDKQSTIHCERSIDSSLDLLHSSLDDKSLALLHPRNIRKHIAALASVSLSNKKNKINESEIKVFAPLSQITTAEEDEPKQKEYIKRRKKKSLKRSVTQQRGISHSSDNDQIDIVPEKDKNVSSTEQSICSYKTEPNYSEIINQKDMLDLHTMEEREKENDFTRHQEQVSPETLMSQLNYLHERVGNIDEGWEETEKKIEEFRSHAHKEYSLVTHQLILNEAQSVLRELQIEVANSSSSEVKYEIGVITTQEINHFPKPRAEYTGNPIMIKSTLKQNHSLRSSTEESDSFMQKKPTGNQSESSLYFSLNTVQEQVRAEKEQFWAALAERGIVAADHTIPLETKVINDLVDHAKEKRIGKDIFV